MVHVKDYYKLGNSNQDNSLTFSSHKKLVKNTPTVSSFLGRKTSVRYLKSAINKHATVFLSGSPEAYSLTTGLVKLGSRNNLRFVPARLHFGIPRSIDNAVACFHCLQFPDVKAKLDGLDNIDKQLLLVDLLREGQKTDTPGAIYYLYGKTPVNIMFKITHAQDDSTSLDRTAVLQEPNLEGVSTNDVTTIIMSDTAASGVTYFMALEYWRKKLPNLKSIIGIAFHLSKYAALKLSSYAKELGIDLILVGYGALLDSIPPEMYLCPTPVTTPKYFVDPSHADLMKYVYKDAASKICVAGNWSAMFLSASEGLRWFEDELNNLGISLDGVTRNLPTNAQLQKMGFSLKDVTPASSYLDALNRDRLEELKGLVS